MAILSLIKGTTGNDTLVGTDLYDVIFGGAGNDTIDGGAGNDKLYGGDGNDTFLGGAGEDQMSGDAGIDTVDYSNSQAAVTVSLSTGTGSGGDAQGDTLSGIENLIGSNDRDHGDNLRGDGGNNIIDGGWGSDFLFGSGGNDTLIGGAGSDTMSGGRDADTFVFNTVHRPGGDVFIEGNDVITDFQVGLDVLEFTGAYRQSGRAFIRQGGERERHRDHHPLRRFSRFRRFNHPRWRQLRPTDVTRVARLSLRVRNWRPPPEWKAAIFATVASRTKTKASGGIPGGRSSHCHAGEAGGCSSHALFPASFF